MNTGKAPLSRSFIDRCCLALNKPENKLFLPEAVAAAVPAAASSQVHVKTVTPARRTKRGIPGVYNINRWPRERCREERLSCRQAAAKAGLSHATIAKIRKGTRPLAETIIKLAEAFSDGPNQRVVLEDYLLTLCGYRNKPPEIKLAEPLVGIVDKLSHFNEAQLKIIDQFAEFVAKIDNVKPQ